MITYLRRCLCAALPIALFACGGFAASAQAHLTWPLYTYSPNCSGGGVDPINVAFMGSGATPGNVKNHIAHHAGWDGSSGDNQSIKTHGGCHQMDTQASLGFFDKHHTRLFENPDSPHVSFGDAHRERLKSCGHAVYEHHDGRSGFDSGQHEIFRDLPSPTHPYKRFIKRPNRRTFKQCTGERVSWNGRTAIFGGSWSNLH